MSATTEQPPPTAGSGSEVWPIILDRYRESPPELLADMRARDSLGRERYGTPLRTWNGRDAVADAYQEALDLVVYVEQARQRLALDGGDAWADRLIAMREMAVVIAAGLRGLHAAGLVPIHPRGEL